MAKNSASNASSAADSGAEPVTIKKYANRRLYNTATSSYVTLDHLSRMVKDGIEFVVYDAKSGDDITRSVLTQIIVEEEAKGQNLLPIGFLRHLISFYDDSLQALVPRYLDYSMQSFARNQEQLRDTMQDSMGGLFPFDQFEEVGKQNWAMFENAMKMFSPFPGAPGNGVAKDRAAPSDGPSPDAPTSDVSTSDDTASAALSKEQLQEMRAKIDQMQKQLDGLTGSDETS